MVCYTKDGDQILYYADKRKLFFCEVAVLRFKLRCASYVFGIIHPENITNLGCGRRKTTLGGVSWPKRYNTRVSFTFTFTFLHFHFSFTLFLTFDTFTLAFIFTACIPWYSPVQFAHGPEIFIIACPAVYRVGDYTTFCKYNYMNE